MDFLNRIVGSEQPLHHFYVLEGFAVSAQERLGTLLKQKGEVIVFTYETLGVSDTADIRARAEERAGGLRFFILKAVSVTHEAQQALLKTFEEPKQGVHFFLVIPDSSQIVPTVQSRAHIIRFTGEQTTYTQAAIEFAQGSKEKRLAYVAALIKKHEDDDSSGELRLEAAQFIAALIENARHDIIANKTFLTDALSMREYLDNRGASVKMILEHLALILA